MRHHQILSATFILLSSGAWLGCGVASTGKQDKIERAPSPEVTAASLIQSVEPEAIAPVSREAAAVTKSRGDAVWVDGSLVLRGASGGLVIDELGDGGDKVLERSVVYLPDAANDVIAHKGVAFVACGPHGVVAVDIADPAKPKPLVTLKTRGAALRLSLLGERLLVANGSMGVVLLDVSDPKKPVPLSIWRSKGYVRHAVLTDDAIFVAEDRSGVSMLTVDERGRMELAWRFDTGGQARAVRVNKDRLFVANGPAGLLLIGLDNGDEPKELGRLVLKDMARDVDVTGRGDRVFVANGDDGIITIDVSSPAAMKEVGAFVPDKPANRIRVEGDRLFVGNDSDGLLILDIANPDRLARVFPPAE